MPDLIDWLVEHEPSFRKSRLPSLYSDLSVQRTTNPEGYSANVLAWQTALIRANVAGKLPNDQKLVIHASEELLAALASPRYGRPSGLGLVFDESVKAGKMLDLKDFEGTEQSIYYHTWLPSPRTVLKWGLRQAGLVGNASYDKSGMLRAGHLVLVPALEEMYKQINAAQTKTDASLTDRIMTREAFNNGLARLNNEALSFQDTEVLLRFLERDKQILSYDSKTVKFKSTASERPEPITTEDNTIASLKSLLVSLESQISNLNIRISTLQKSAKSAVESKNRTAALSALRSKKLAEGALQQRTETLTQLEEVYSKIEQAMDQAQIVEMMQSSASVLKGLNRKIGGVEKVENVVEELREEMSKVDEVEQVLQEPLDGKMILDEAEVDDELEEMEKEEARKEDERKAEATRKRLAELEHAEDRKQMEAERQAQDEESVRSSIELLGRMKIDQDNDQEKVQASGQRQPLSEHAS